MLKDEFFPIMDEIKEFIGTLTTAGKGIVGLPRFIYKCMKLKNRAVDLNTIFLF